MLKSFRKKKLLVLVTGMCSHVFYQLNKDCRNLDNLAKALSFNIQWGRVGLLGFVDEQFKGRLQTHQAIRSEIPAIMKLATDVKAGLLPAGPPSPPPLKKVAKTKPVEKPAPPPATEPVDLLAKLAKRQVAKEATAGPPSTTS